MGIFDLIKIRRKKVRSRKKETKRKEGNIKRARSSNQCFLCGGPMRKIKVEEPNVAQGTTMFLTTGVYIPGTIVKTINKCSKCGWIE